MQLVALTGSSLSGCRRGSFRLPDGARMDWLRLGMGPLPVVVVPGAGDGLWTVGQTAPLLAWRYRRRVRSQRLLVLGRRDPIPSGFGVDRLADDYVHAVEHLNWSPSVWECVSAGGPIGQWSALRRPDLVRGLILASSMHRTDEALRSVLAGWIRLAEDRRWTDLYWSIAQLNRRPSQGRGHIFLRRLLGLMPAPRRPRRFVHLLDGLMDLDHSAMIGKIECPTLVIGGEADRIVSADVQREMAALIPNSRLVLYRGYGHDAPMEHPDYDSVTRCFMGDVHRAPP